MIDWSKLRPFSGSQDGSFEELCCQLAECEKVPSRSIFIRKAPPDAGIECYWILPDGSEWGWQAKFFLTPPNSSQWAQIDESVVTALDKHPKIVKYTICLPIDRSDPRIDNQKWFMDKWNKHVDTWKDLAKSKGLSISFEYWGKHEIFKRLSLEEHHGRLKFWFDQQCFSKEWFENKLKETISNAGPRYTPELNIDLPISKVFEGLGRTTEFYNEILNKYGIIRRAFEEINSNLDVNTELGSWNDLSNKIQKLLYLVRENCENHLIEHSFEEISKNIKEILALNLDYQNKLKEKRELNSHNDSEIKINFRNYDNIKNKFDKLNEKLYDLDDFVNGYEASSSNTAALLLTGNAGTGKTHLLCDISQKRIDSDKPTVMLIGSHFKDEEPCTQILRELKLKCDWDQFLGALESCANANRSKALIIIDGINEGDGKKLWKKYLRGILETFSKCKWISLVISIRSSYEKIIIPEDIGPKRLTRVIHQGFSENEYEATKKFFCYYQIEFPSIPLLNPEFQNPLFLKLFCENLKNRKLNRMPAGLYGVTSVFDSFIDSINEKLSGFDYLDLDENLKIVQKAINSLSEKMVNNNERWLNKEESQNIVNFLSPNKGYRDSLFWHMISEGIISEDVVWDKSKIEYIECIQFSYERFTDHILANYLLDKYLDQTDQIDSFQKDKPLGKLIENEGTCSYNRGILEAFCIQIPERINRELVDVAPYCASFITVKEAFINSLIFRKPTAIFESTRKYINKYIIRSKFEHDLLLDAFITVALNKEHPYNANFLHKHLMRFEMAERDAFWTIFIHEQYGNMSSVDRLIEWGFSDEDKSYIDDESIRLSGIVLAWFLTSSNRFLRDRATKALVSLLTKRLHVLKQILELFQDVNDPYVSERLYAVAYGCSMRSINIEEIEKLASYIYEMVFQKDPYPNILFRDYARGVIELALYYGIKLNINFNKIRPPYKSEWPSHIPTEEEISHYGDYKKVSKNEEWSLIDIYSSVMHEDFARYVIHPNFHNFEWSSHLLDQPKEKSPQEIFEEFIVSLTKKQMKAWNNFKNLKMMNQHHIKITHKETEDSKIQITIKYDDETLKAEKEFCNTLGKNKLEIYRNIIINIDELKRKHEDKYRFDLRIAQRWIFQKVLHLGWTVNRFGKFDREVKRYSYTRSSNKPERIGKKYQWIAFYEFLSKVTDNFEYKGDRWHNENEKYEGPWQISYLRDIDPSCILKKTEKEDWESHTINWWFPNTYNLWNLGKSKVDWLKTSADLPDVKSLIEVENPESLEKWLTLEGFYLLEQPTPPEEDKHEITRGEIWYSINSYMVKKIDAEELFGWLLLQNFSDRKMPKSHELTDVFLGEFFWSPAFLFHNDPYYFHDSWTDGYDEQIPKKILVTSDQYFQSAGSYDCSIEDTIKIYLPCKWLVDNMKLSWKGREGHFYDKNGTLIAFDPSINSKGPGALLINKNNFSTFLKENNYDILWTLQGEKQLTGGDMSFDNWEGRLELSGAYRIINDEIVGSFHTNFVK